MYKYLRYYILVYTTKAYYYVLRFKNVIANVCNRSAISENGLFAPFEHRIALPQPTSSFKLITATASAYHSRFRTLVTSESRKIHFRKLKFRNRFWFWFNKLCCGIYRRLKRLQKIF